MTAILSPPLALAIVGPTAAGKSRLALEAARRYERPLLVCDSVKVYRGLDIGSAKPSAADRAAVPHRLLDLVDPDQGFSAGDYARAARDVFDREGGIFVGGTGFYLRATAWNHGRYEGADVSLDDPVRAEFSSVWQARERSQPGAAHRALSAIDPETAASIHPHNLVRIVRALWLCHAQGGPVSRLRKRQSPTPRVRLILVVFDPERDGLVGRIERRVDAMLSAGWLGEVEGLVRCGYDARHKAMRSLGYKQLVDVVLGHTDLATAREDIIRATTRYARRQRTYFRHQLPAERVITVADARACPWEHLDACMRPGHVGEGARV